MRGHRRGDQTFVWVAIEASNKVDGEDIRRARETADILELLFEGEFLAVAVGATRLTSGTEIGLTRPV